MRKPCGNPILRPSDRASRVFGENAAIVWLWAWPQLLRWRLPVQWLFCSVTGNRPGRGAAKAGDLWGIDAGGDLLILEAKSCIVGRPGQDPFLDFLGPAKPLARRGVADTDAGTLRDEWLRRLEQERRFATEHGDDILSGVQLARAYPGLLPYSSRRASLQIWRELYQDRILPRITGTVYERTVAEYLANRRRRRNPIPHFVGLLVGRGNVTPRLSPRGELHMRRLEKLVPGRVHTRLIRSVVGRENVTVIGSA